MYCRSALQRNTTGDTRRKTANKMFCPNVHTEVNHGVMHKNILQQVLGVTHYTVLKSSVILWDPLCDAQVVQQSSGFSY